MLPMAHDLQIIDKTQNYKDSKSLVDMLNGFYPYALQRLKHSKPFTLFLTSDQQNAKNPLGKTGFYNPESFEITLFVDGRHPKDVLRSFAHEMVHHTQNCRGEFVSDVSFEGGYAQNNKHLRELEREAYEKGNLLLRDWEDQIKQKRGIMESKDKKNEPKKFKSEVDKEIYEYVNAPKDKKLFDELMRKWTKPTKKDSK